MKPHKRFIGLMLGAGLLTLLAGPVWAQEYSHARIVRLSFVEGTVTMQRPDVSDWAEAPVNTPIQEGFKLSAAEKSFAEVEFESGSTIRLGQLSLLEFSQLALLPSGGKLNRLALLQGYATFHALPEGEDVYEVSTPNGLLTARGKALFRVDLDEGAERVEVFNGTVEVTNNTGSWSLAKNDVLELRPGNEQPYSLTQGITQDAWDEWVSERENREQMTSTGNAPSPRLYSNNVSDLLYGWNDLSTYGLWSYLPGWGYGWVPTVAGGWAPYRSGRWCWYPGFHWVWISGEPWGWLPFHYGGWQNVAGIGWAWFPDNFAYFSPGLVTWYSGPGWIGWVPRGPMRGHGAPNPCPPGQPCGTAVSTTTFRNGIVVTPSNRLGVDPIQGRPVDQAGIPPTRAATLPGPAVANPLGKMSASGRIPAGEPGVRVPQTFGTSLGGGIRGGRTSPAAPASAAAGNAVSGRAAPAPHSTVVFDPVDDRYVNNPASGMAPHPVQPSSEGGSPPRGEARDAGGAPVEGVVPRLATAPGAQFGDPASSGTTAGRVSPAPSTATGAAPSTGAPRQAPPRETAKPAPVLRERFGGAAREGPAGSMRGGGSGESRALRSGGGDFGGGARPAGGSTGAGGAAPAGHGSAPSSGASPHPH